MSRFSPLIIAGLMTSLGCKLVCRDGYGLANDDKCYPLADTGAQAVESDADTDTDTDTDTDADTDTDTDADTDITAILSGQVTWDSASAPTDGQHLHIGAWSWVDVDEDLWPTSVEMMIAYASVGLETSDGSGADFVLPVQFEGAEDESIEWLNLEVFAFLSPDLETMLEGPGSRYAEGPVAISDGTYASDVDIHLSAEE